MQSLISDPWQRFGLFLFLILLLLLLQPRALTPPRGVTTARPAALGRSSIMQSLWPDNADGQMCNPHTEEHKCRRSERCRRVQNQRRSSEGVWAEIRVVRATPRWINILQAWRRLMETVGSEMRHPSFFRNCFPAWRMLNHFATINHANGTTLLIQTATQISFVFACWRAVECFAPCSLDILYHWGIFLYIYFWCSVKQCSKAKQMVPAWVKSFPDLF